MLPNLLMLPVLQVCCSSVGQGQKVEVASGWIMKPLRPPAAVGLHHA